MKAQLGKPTGLALALLAALLATFFAMGVFSVAQANSHHAERSFSANTVAPGAELVVTIAVTDFNGIGDVVETLPTGFSYVSSDAPISRPQPGNQVRVTVLSTTSFTYTVTATDVEGSYDFSGTFEFGTRSSRTTVDVGGATTVTVAAATNGGNGGGNGGTDSAIKLSSHEPGAAVQITITDTAAADINPNEEIQVDLKSAFSVPDTIAESDIAISSTGFNGSPSNVLVTGKKVTMTIPTVTATVRNPSPVMGGYTIRIKQSAGVMNAASGGTKTIKWVERYPSTDEADMKSAEVMIDRVIKLSTTAGTRGTMTTATFKGFANGSATVNLNGEKLDEVTITDNTGTLEIDTTSSKFKANQDNTITAQDAAGNSGDVSASFTISAKAVVDPEESPVSKDVTIKLSDWPASNMITKVTIGASDVTPDSAKTTDSDGKVEFKVMVPAGANRGTQTVKVTGTEVDDSTPSATASLKVGVLALTVQPAMVVPGQQITIEGSGFVSGDEISSVSIGNQTAGVDATANSAGDIVIAVDVPSDEDGDGIGSGKKTVSVTATGSGRVAEGSIEIPKAVITLDPVTSRRGTTVNVSGNGFPSGDLVQVKYDNDGTFVTVAAGSADASGAVSIDFTVPSYARIGAKHNIEATSVGIFKGVTAKATHETPGAMVTLSSDSISSGENITIAGVNFPAFATVAVMEIGGVDVRPVPAPATSIDGDFESTVLVPQLELGNQTVSIRVSSTTITTFLELSTATVSRAPADVFASLGDRLVRVWYLERSTQVWSFYDPDPDVAAFNTLTQVSSGQNVSIIISSGANIGFQDKTLYPGTNPIALD